ncbi:MAG: P-II family nitrogen regulator [Thermoproteota archaeon]
MKKIETIIRPDKFFYVKEALSKAGYTSLTVYDVKGRGRQSGIIQTINGKTIRADLLPKVKIEIIVSDEEVERVVEIILKTARTGAIGDGKIFVSSIDDAIRIRTCERGNQAL